MTNAFAINSEKFSGPIELLLELVEKQKLHISEVSLSKVADDFLTYIESVGELPVADTANFVYVASILLLIKSKALLPNLELSSEETADIKDLEERLAIYQILVKQGEAVASLLTGNSIYMRQDSLSYLAIFNPGRDVSLDALRVSLQDLLSRTVKQVKLVEKVITKVISLDDIINNLHERIGACLRMSFKEFSNKDRGEKIEVIVSFLAMLELVKRGILSVSQQGRHADIEMETTQNSTPTYS